MKKILSWVVGDMLRKTRFQFCMYVGYDGRNMSSGCHK